MCPPWPDSVQVCPPSDCVPWVCLLSDWLCVCLCDCGLTMCIRVPSCLPPSMPSWLTLGHELATAGPALLRGWVRQPQLGILGDRITGSPVIMRLSLPQGHSLGPPGVCWSHSLTSPWPFFPTALARGRPVNFRMPGHSWFWVRGVPEGCCPRELRSLWVG